MARTQGDAQHTAASMTRCALALLDITFEPATVCAGERFDLVVEALADQLTAGASSLLAGRDLPPFTPPALPPLSGLVTRRAQSALRENLAAGRLPGQTRSIAACADGLRRVRDDVSRLDAEQPDLRPPLLHDLGQALGRLTQVIESYRVARVRTLAGMRAESSMPAGEVADLATRSERALVRCLDRVGDDRVLR